MAALTNTDPKFTVVHNIKQKKKTAFKYWIVKWELMYKTFVIQYLILGEVLHNYSI